MEQEHIRSVLTREIAAELRIDPARINGDTSFMRLGLASVQALKVINRVRLELEIDINPVALFEFNTIEDISDYIADEFA